MEAVYKHSVIPQSRIHSQHLVSAAILVAFLAARIYNLGAYGLWLDECFSANTSLQTWEAMFDLIIADVVHPPLFYAFLKVWIMIGGESLIWIKLLPFLFSAATIPFLFLLLDKLKLSFPKKNFVFFLFAVNPFLIYYAQELRMYSQLLFFTVVSLYFFASFIQDQVKSKPAIFLFLANICLVYTQYYGLLVVGIEFLVGLIYARAHLKKLLLPTFGAVIAFIPWILLVANAIRQERVAGGNLDWLERPTVSDAIWFFGQLNGNTNIRHSTLLVAILFTVVLSFGFLTLLFKRNNSSIRNLFIFSAFGLIPIVISFTASYILPQSVFGDRYLIITAIPYFIVLMLAVFAISKRFNNSFLIGIVLVWCGGTALYNMTTVTIRTDWIKISEFIHQKAVHSDAVVKIYTSDNWVSEPLKHRFSKNGLVNAHFHPMEKLLTQSESDFWIVSRTPINDQEDQLKSQNCFVEDSINSETLVQTTFASRFICR